MIDALVIRGSDLAVTITSLFGEPTCSTIHVHNASRGCWAVKRLAGPGVEPFAPRASNSYANV